MAKQPAGLKRYWATHSKKNKTRAASAGRGARMAQKHHKQKITIPLAVVMGFAPAVLDVQRTHVTYGGYPQAIIHTGAGLFGWDTVSNKWGGFTQMKYAGTFPIILGFLVHWIAGKAGVNRMIGRMGIPLIRI